MRNVAAQLFGVFLAIIPFDHYGQIKLTGRDFTLLEATQENWSPGFSQPNQPRQGGVIYRIKVVSRVKTIASVDSMVIANNRYSVEIIKGVVRSYSGPILKGDTLDIICRREYSEQDKLASRGIRKLATKYNHQGYVYYRKGKRKQLFPIPTFVKYESKGIK